MHTADRLLSGLLTFFAIFAGAIVVSIAAVLVFNVALGLRGGGNVYGMVDAIELGLMALTFLAAPWVLRKNAHVSVDLVLRGLGPRARRLLMIATDIVGLSLSGVMCWASGKALMLSFVRGSLMRGVLAVPEWLVLMAPTVGTALLAAEFLRRALQGQEQNTDRPGL